MAVNFHSEQTSYKLRDKRRVTDWLKAVIESEGHKTGAVAVVLCGGEYHLEINRKFLGHDYRTDVITFDYGEPEKKLVSGDILIDPDTVEDNARGLGVDAHQELLRVIVHGVLHLCGHGDATASERQAMRELEDKYLSLYR